MNLKIEDLKIRLFIKIKRFENLTFQNNDMWTLSNLQI